MSDQRETAWDFLEGNSYATMYTSQRKWLNRIERWKDQYPDEVKVMHINEDESILVHIPEKWVKIKPPKVLSSEHIKKMRDGRNNKEKTEHDF